MKFKVTKPQYNELPQIYEMLWRSFEYHFKHSPRDYFKPFVEKNPFYKNENFFIVKYNERIVSSIQVFLLDVYFKNKKLLIGGIGQVATLPEFRGKGLAGVLLKEAIKYMKKSNVDYSLLFAGPVPLYEKYGWKEIPVKSFVADVKQKKLSVDSGTFKIKKYNNSLRYDLFYIHNQFIRNFNSCVVRNPLYWDSYFWQFKAKDTKIYLLQKNNKSVAYIVIKKEKRNLSIYEYCSLDTKNQKYFKTLLEYIIKKYKPEEILIPYGNKNYIPSVVLKNEFNAKSQNVSGFMVRNINRQINWKKEVPNVLFFLGDAF